MHTVANDLDYLAARLHGRRSRMAEGQRLEQLSACRSIAELGRALFPEMPEFAAAGALQRQLVRALAEELSELAQFLDEPEARLLDWMLVRFQVLNLKVLLRGVLTGASRETMEEHLVWLPRNLALQTQALASAGSVAEFARRVPSGPLCESLQQAEEPEAPTKPFFLEAALDRGYFRELLSRTGPLLEADQEVVRPLVCQEVDLFHLMLLTRGKFHYGLSPRVLLALHVEGAAISRGRFITLLCEPELRPAAHLVVGLVLDASPPDPATGEEPGRSLEPAALETLAWQRFLRLANAAFRRGHLGLGAVVGYAALRRVEVANLITLSEGICSGLGVEALRARLLPRSHLEAAYV